MCDCREPPAASLGCDALMSGFQTVREIRCLLGGCTIHGALRMKAFSCTLGRRVRRIHAAGLKDQVTLNKISAFDRISHRN